MNYRKYLVLIILLAVLLGIAGNVSSAKPEIPVATNLSELGKQAKRKNLPILLMVSAHHCPYCELLKNEIINPMMVSGDYTDKVIMSELVLDWDSDIIGFDGAKKGPEDIANDYYSVVTPTILFLDHNGREVQKRMIGVNTVEMYGFYLDESIARALKKVRKKSRAK